MIMYDEEGNSFEANYDQDNDMTTWETYDADGNQTGGGQLSGDQVDKLESDRFDQGYGYEGPS